MAFDAQNSFLTRLHRTALAVLVGCCIVLMALYSHEGADGPLHRLQGFVRAAIAPVEMVGMPASAALDEAAQGNADASASEETLSQLREQNAELAGMLAQAEELRLENERLKQLVNLVTAYDIEGATGHVVGRSTDAWNQTVTLDVGSSSGVEEGLTVVGATGVVGQVVSVAPASCVVRLLTDPQSGAAALVQSSRAEGIVRGSLAGVLYLEDVAADVNVEVGDVVLTSGLGGSYARGLLVGTVVRVEGSAADASRKIVIAQNDTPTPLEELTVVTSAKAPAALDSGSRAQGSQDEGEGE